MLEIVLSPKIVGPPKFGAKGLSLLSYPRLHWSKVKAWNFTIETFKTCQFKERLFICRLKSELDC